MKKLRFTSFIILAVVFGFIPQAQALVSLGNGNYFVGFTDIEHPAPLNSFQLKIQRTRRPVTIPSVVMR